MKTVLLGDVANFIQGIQVEPSKQTITKKDGFVRFIRIVDFTKENEPMRYILDPGERYSIDKADVAMIRYGSQTAGRVVTGLDGAIANNLFKINYDKSALDGRFLYYLLSRKEIYKNLNIGQSSSTMPAITFSQISKLNIPLPPINTQREIVNILDKIDEKIELNRRMNETLEQIGQALFKHYFIDNPKTKTWPIGIFADLTDVITGKGSTKSVLSEGGKYPLYGAGGIMGTSDTFLLDEPVIITGRVGTLGRIQAVTGKAWFSDNVLIMKPKSGYFGLVYYLLKSFDFVSMNRGSSQPLITQTDLKNRTIALPDNGALLEFESQFQSSFVLKQKNAKANQTLIRLRDSLLPHLISGKIKI